MNDLKVYECFVEDWDECGIYDVSFVTEPAVEENFVALSKQEVMLHTDKHKQILTGVLLKPNQLIYRCDGTSEYYITFTEQQIEAIAHKMMREQVALTDTSHQHQARLKGNYLVELWIVQDPTNDKAKALGFDVPKGTLMCSYKITDKSYWDNEVLTGNVRGFSLEGLFNQAERIENKLNKQDIEMSILNKIKALLESVEDIDQVTSKDVTESGELVRTFELYDGQTLTVDAEGFATIDGEQAQAGTHKLLDGNYAVVDEAGLFVCTQEEEVTEGDKAPEEALTPEELAKEDEEKEEKEDETVTEEEEVTEDEETDDSTNEKKEDEEEEKLEDEDESEDLKKQLEEANAKIKELEDELAKLKGENAEKEAEITELKKVTPKVNKVESRLSNAKASKISRMSNVLNSFGK